MTVSIRHRADLLFSEELVLWAIRQWTAARMTNSPCDVFLRDAFRLARAPGAALALDGLMTTTNAACQMSIEIRPPVATEVIDDEVRLLTILAFTQLEGGTTEARDLLAIWLPPTGQRLALRHCIDFAGHLVGGGHLLRPFRIDDVGRTQRSRGRDQLPIPNVLN